MTMQSDDMEAIDRYMKEAPVYTQLAQNLKDSWIRWYDNIGPIDLRFNSDIFDQARNRKNAFNLANTRSAVEREQVKEQIKTAVTSEELRGEPRRMLSDGTYGNGEEGEPFFPTRVKIAAGIAAGAFVGLWTLKKIYVDPFLRRR